MIKIRNKIFARKKRQPKNVNCKHLYNLETVNKDIKKLKKIYYADYFTEHVNNNKFNSINLFLCNKMKYKIHKLHKNHIHIHIENE